MSAEPSATSATNGDAPDAQPDGVTATSPNATKPSQPVSMDEGKNTAQDKDSKQQEDDGSGSAKPAGETSSTAVAANAEDNHAKNKQKRRSSAGVPEHKSKKLNRKKSMPALHLDAKPGDHYWAKMKGFPPWPSIICDEEMLPESLLANRPVTAMRPDGSYRTDYEEGGKNVKDRTYPVMYLDTFEFSWTPNTDLEPIDIEEIHKAEQGKKTKSLWAAYQIAKEDHDLQYFKDMLVRHQKELEEEHERRAQEAAERQARKDKKSKRKSKDTVDEDEVMEDVPEADADAKKSKKRKKGVDEDEDETPAKTPKSIKLQSKKTENTEPASKIKPKPKAKTPKSSNKSSAKPKAEPSMTEDEKREKRHKEILFFRHKLQKGFLSQQPPKDDEMQQMADYFHSLETQKDIEASIIKSTKIHKVLKGIVKLTSIPRDEEYNFKERSAKLLEDWSKILGEDTAVSAETKGQSSGKKDPDNAEHNGAEESIKGEPEDKENGAGATKDESAEEPDEKATEAKDKPDVAMEDVQDDAAKTEDKATAEDVTMENGA